MARPRKAVDLAEVIARQWNGESFPAIARRMHLGYGTVVRSFRKAKAALQAVQNAKAGILPTVTDDGSEASRVQ